MHRYKESRITRTDEERNENVKRIMVPTLEERRSL
jgi:hypothetical protein